MRKQIRITDNYVVKQLTNANLPNAYVGSWSLELDKPMYQWCNTEHDVFNV